MQDHDSFLAAAKRTPVDLEEWAVSMMERHNRKSHLAPQLSPSTQSLLRGNSAASPSKESSTSSKTPTSGEIPISQDIKPPKQAEPANSRAQTSDSNGVGVLSSQNPGPERPFPPRTSSNSTIPSGRQRESSGFNPAQAAQIRSPGYNPAIPPSRGKENDGFSSANLPIRPAPPPSGPLPVPPGASSKYLNSRRSGANGYPYSNSETPPH